MPYLLKGMNQIISSEESKLAKILNDGYIFGSKPQNIENWKDIETIINHMTNQDNATNDGQFGFLEDVIKEKKEIESDKEALEKIPSVNNFLKRMNNESIKEKLKEKLVRITKEKYENQRWIIYEVIALIKAEKSETNNDIKFKYAKIQNLEEKDIETLIPFLGIIFLTGLKSTIESYELKNIKLQPSPIAISYHWNEKDMNDKTREMYPHIHLLYAI